MLTQRERKRRYLNTIWLLLAISLVLLVVSGFAFLISNFFHDRHYDLASDSQIGGGSGHLDSILTIDYQVPNRNKQPVDEVVKPSVPQRNEFDLKQGLFSENVDVQLSIISRHEWLAHPAHKRQFFTGFAIDKAIILETGTEYCNSPVACAQVVRDIQKTDLRDRGRDDIRYNFLIGGDGSIFEGRGFNTVGDHTKGYNDNSLGVALIGKFEAVSPTEQQIVALKRLLQYGISHEHLKSNYELFGHCQLSGHPGSKNPGNKLYEIIQKWPHWTENNFYKTN